MGILSRYYSYYGDSNHWNDETVLSYHYMLYERYYFATVAFDCLVVLALLSFAVWACTIRNAISPLRATIVVLVTWLIANGLEVVVDILYLAVVVVKQSYVIIYILEDAFELASNCLLFAVFYMIIHRFMDHLTDSGKPYAALNAIHWAVVGIVTLISIADFGLYTAIIVKQVEEDLTLKLVENQPKVYTARCIIYFIVSLEILAWTIFVAVKAGSHRFISKMPVMCTAVASLLWFGYNLMYAIVAILYELKDPYFTVTPAYLGTVEGVFQFVFIIGIFTGLLLGLGNWHKIDGQGYADPTSVQYPYSSVPGPYSHGYQQQQHGYQQGPVLQQQPYIQQQQPHVYQQQPQY